MADVPEYSNVNDNRVPCSVCGRMFNDDVLKRHIAICQKSASKKRKIFDSSKQRYAGIEAGEGPVPQPPKPSAKNSRQPVRGRQEPTYKTNWRKQHEEFVNTIRAARGVSVALKTGGPLPPPPPASENPDYITCDYCGRRFNESAAERHINFCREQKSRITNKPIISDQAKMRAAARNQYKPPRLKSKMPGQQDDYSSPQSRPSQSNSSSNSSGGRHRPSPVGGEIYTNGRSRPSVDSSGIAAPGGIKKSPSNDRVQQGSLGQVLRTGRDPQSYQEARKGVRANMVATTRYPGSLESINSPTSDSSSRYSPGYTPSPPSSGTRRGSHPRTYAGHDELDAPRGRPTVGRTAVNSVNNPAGMSKFCHECGTKYPVMNAKFCCECGCRRMAPQTGDGSW